MNELKQAPNQPSLVEIQRQSYHASPRLDQVVWEAKSQDTGNVLFEGSQTEVASWIEIHLFTLAELGVNAYSVPTERMLS